MRIRDIETIKKEHSGFRTAFVTAHYGNSRFDAITPEDAIHIEHDEADTVAAKLNDRLKEIWNRPGVVDTEIHLLCRDAEVITMKCKALES